MASHNLRRGVILGTAAAMLSGCGSFADRVAAPIVQAVKLEPRLSSADDRYQKMIFLVGRLMMGEEQEREDAAGKLGLLRDARAVSALVRALKDPSKRVRGNAAWALGEIGDRSAVPALTDTLNDEDPITRQDAAMALGKIGSLNPPAASRPGSG